jgi:hypothetical protein
MLYEQAAYQAAARRRAFSFLTALNDDDLSRLAASVAPTTFDEWWLPVAIAEEVSRRRATHTEDDRIPPS